MGTCWTFLRDDKSKDGPKTKSHVPSNRSPEERHLLDKRKDVELGPANGIMGETHSTQKPSGVPQQSTQKGQQNGGQRQNSNAGKSNQQRSTRDPPPADDRLVGLSESESDDASEEVLPYNPLSLKQASMNIPHFDGESESDKFKASSRDPWGPPRGPALDQEIYPGITGDLRGGNGSEYAHRGGSESSIAGTSYSSSYGSDNASELHNTSAPSLIRTNVGKKGSSHRPRTASQPVAFGLGKPHPLATQESHENLSYSSIREEIKKHPEMLNEPSHSPKLIRSAIPPHAKGDFHRVKSSSTSTLFMNSTIKAPDNEEIVRCMAKALYWAAKKSETVPRKRIMDVFNEELHPLQDYVDTDTPMEDTIFKFLSVIFSGEQLSAECGVMGMAYIDRLIALTGVTLCGKTWRRIVLGALILASKVWEDQAVWNVDFISVFPKVTVKDLNSLERAMLNALQFNVSLKASVYAKYYFELRSLSERDAQHFPLMPLDREASAKLEARSRGLEKESRKKRITRSRSADEIHASSTPVSLPQ